MTKFILLTLFLIFSLIKASNFEFRISGEQNKSNKSSYFFLPKDKETEYQITSELIWKWQKYGLSSNSSLNFKKLEDGKYKKHLFLNELFYDSNLGDWEFSIGKKRLGYGVAQAFRPMDIIQSETRRTLTPKETEGIPSFILEKFTATGSISLIYATQSSWRTKRIEIKKNNFVIRPYLLLGNWDILGILHTDDKGEFNLGIATSGVMGESWKIHFESLHKTQYYQWKSLLTKTNNYVGEPMYQKKMYNAFQAVVGANWTGQSGIGFLTEYWYDGTAYNKSKWEDLIDLSKSQTSLLSNLNWKEVAQNRIESLEKTYKPKNLLQHNILFRFSFDGEIFNPEVDYLLTPQDMGNVTTFSIKNDITEKQKISFGFRLFGGPNNSAFGESKKSSTIFATWELAWE